MKKYLIVLLIIGIACGQEEKDMIILKNGDRYYGDYVGDLNEFVIIFKPSNVGRLSFITLSSIRPAIT